jgi:hypothetical protein
MMFYVRQSTGAQVHDNRESQRRQYELADLARTYGFRDVTTIDDDLGRSASGLLGPIRLATRTTSLTGSETQRTSGSPSREAAGHSATRCCSSRR